MTTLELKSEKREILGKKVKTLRNKGLIPAVVYGGKEGTILITVDAKEFHRVFKTAGETTLVKLSTGGEGVKNVLIHGIARDAVKGNVQHVDFYEVKMDKKIIAKIPLVFVGDALAIIDLGGVLVKAMQELEVRAFPANLPHEIAVNISALKTFDDNIAVRDIKVPDGVEVLESLETSVASVIPPRSEAEIESLTGEVEEKIEEIKVETEEKTKERQEEKAAETKEKTAT